jgi:hypothetical protein
MTLRVGVGFIIIGFFILVGCAKRVLVTYDHIEKTNSAEVTLTSGRKIKGTVVKTEPHQLTLLQKDQKLRRVTKSTIRTIMIKQPVYDEFGNGISEEEIESVLTKRNTIIYGIGGGALSFGASFFVGSLIGHSGEKGGTILAASTVVGSGLGTVLFVKAGKARDRHNAIEKIRDRRASIDLKEDEEKSPDELRKLLENEKKKQEELRKKREQLLRELEEKKKKKKK